MREVALEEGLVGEVGGFAGYGSVLEGQLCQVSREMAGPPGTSPCPLCAEYYTCASYPAPTLQYWGSLSQTPHLER